MLALDPLEIIARAADGDFSRTQLTGESVAFELIAIDLGCDLIDLCLDGLQLSLGFLAVRLRGRCARRAVRERQERAGERSERGGFARRSARRLRALTRDYWLRGIKRFGRNI